MNPIEELIAEHEGIKVSLEILDRISRRMVTAEPVELKDAQDLVEFYKVFVDTCHHEKKRSCFSRHWKVSAFPETVARSVSC